MMSVLQWNTQGLRHKKNEILDLISNNNINIIAIQETKLSGDYNLKIPNFNLLYKDGHFNRTQHGGVALYLHCDLPIQEISLNTPLQAVAVTVQTRFRFTICNIYTSPNHDFSLQLIKNIYDQLPKPCLIVGDFNAHHPRWGDPRTDARGNIMVDLIDSTDLVLLNDGSPTRTTHNSHSAIDLTFCTASIALEFDWRVHKSPLFSDHNPILIDIQTTEDNPIETQSWNLKKANWDLYTSSSAWDNLPPLELDNEELVSDLYRRITQACTESIPTYLQSKHYPKPWWSEELKASKQRREHLYRKYKRTQQIEDHIKWKRARAQHTNMCKNAKKEDWQKFTTDLKRGAPESQVYNKLRKIKGKPPTKINILQENGIVYSTCAEISSQLANNFRKASSTNNYDEEFSNLKRNKEQNPIEFGQSNNIYNSDFTQEEFLYSLNKTRNTAPGQDQVNYDMIKKLPPHAQQHILKLYNKFFRETFFPEQWIHAVIIAIPKPGKDHSSPTNYRPIALLSCLCKLMERMINERLTEYLLIHNVITPEQCGCTKGKSTLDHLTRMENSVRTAFAHNQHYISIFFDIEKAYDMTWRRGILEDLYNCGMRGNLPKYIEAFLKKRLFRVNTKGHMSQTEIQENGVPQGSPLSPTLFALKVNSIATLIPSDPGFMFSLYVDDLQVGLRHSNLNILQNNLQSLLTNLHIWSKTN